MTMRIWNALLMAAEVDVSVPHVVALATRHVMVHPHHRDAQAVHQVVRPAVQALAEVVARRHVEVAARRHVEVVAHHRVEVVAHRTVLLDAPELLSLPDVLRVLIRVAVVAQTIVQKIAATTVKMVVVLDAIMGAMTVVRAVVVQLV